ncbi:transglycosylase domain-containing protein [Carbonactinospora thermoautotrophica]|uniref:transglycosylase domain-containing protein n=1 Tax=Carbonactinospora thermoautotrophica TaxID=1469144 RepID=UPI003DA7AD94
MSRLPSVPDRGFAQQVTMFVGVSVLAGLLLAGLLLPFVGAAGLSARSAAEGFQNIPGDLRQVPLAQRTRILDARGRQIAVLFDENRIVVPLSKMAKVMQQAIIAIEDARFYEHGGFDLKGTLRALITNTQAGDTVQGGSSITQQYVKNALIEAANGDEEQIRAAREQTVARKIRELKYAIALEEQLPKDKILENYLNIAYFGGGAYGVEAAARHYFNTSAADLTLPQAALIAGLVRNPAAYDPVDHPEAARTRRNTVISRMAELKMITPEQAARAKAAGLGLKIRPTRNGCANAQPRYNAWFCDYVTRLIETDPAFGATPEERRALLRRGGLTIRTTLDPTVQKAAYNAIVNRVYPTDRVASAMSVVGPGTGQIKAMVQSKGYGGTGGINYNVEHKYHGSQHGFQAGSTFKVFVAAAALQQGIRGDHTIFSPNSMTITEPYQTCDQPVRDTWTVSNELSSEHGNYNMAQALALSINTYFAQLEKETGICEPLKLAKAMGVKRGDGGEWRQVKSFTLGVNEVTPLSMAGAYATFAARGMHCEPYAITSITTADGRQLPVRRANCQQVLEERIADAMNALLKGVIEHGTGAGRANIGRPAAGKTGTTQDRKDVWFVGYTPQLSGAVWVGSAKTPFPLRYIRIGGRYWNDVCSGCLPAPIWKNAMKTALDGVPVQDFAPAPGDLIGNIFNTPQPQDTPPQPVQIQPQPVPPKPSDFSPFLPPQEPANPDCSMWWQLPQECRPPRDHDEERSDPLFP